MRFARIAVTVTAGLAVAVALVGCGGDSGGDVVPMPAPAEVAPSEELRLEAAPNGLESRGAAEVIDAAAAAMREVDSVRWIGRGTGANVPPLTDLRIAADGSATGFIEFEGERIEVLGIDGNAYSRGAALLAEFPQARPDQWIQSQDADAVGLLTLDTLAGDIAGIEVDAATTVEQVTEQDQPAVRITTGEDTLYVSNVGPALPLRQIDRQGGDTVDQTFTEYGAPVQADRPADSEIFVPAAAPR